MRWEKFELASPVEIFTATARPPMNVPNDSKPSRGFVALIRGEKAEELLQYPNAFILCAQIALRARYAKEPSLAGLGHRQAMIGDHDSLNMTRAEYRAAMNQLTRFGLASFRGVRSMKRGARGTIATLLNDEVFSINAPLRGHGTTTARPQNDQRHDHHSLDVNEATTTINSAINATTEQPSNDHQTATKNKGTTETGNKGRASPPFFDLPLPDRQTVANKLRLSESQTSEALAAFENHKRHYPNDPRDADAVVHWFLNHAAGKQALSKIRASKSAPGPSEAGDEPPGWRAFVDSHWFDCVYATGNEQADKPWAALDAAVQDRIKSEMAKSLAATEPT